jgi:hypothetical protein
MKTTSSFGDEGGNGWARSEVLETTALATGVPFASVFVFNQKIFVSGRGF